MRDWLHVDDHFSGIDFVLHEGAPGEAYNIGGEEQENLTMVRHFLRLTSADDGLVRHVEDRPGHDRRYAIDDGKLRSLGWAPVTAVENGLATTVAWYAEHRGWWEPIKSGEFRAYYDRQYGERLAAAT